MERLAQVMLLLLLLCGCRKDLSVETIDSDIHVRLWETLDSTARTLKFFCSTERTYGCSNYGIGHTLNSHPGHIDVTFDGILVQDLCLTSIGPATTTIDLGTLSEGTYDLDIRVEQKRSQGRLFVTPDHYSIILDEQRQLVVRNSPLLRIPANTIWGTVGYHSNSTAALVQSFMDSLQLAGATVQSNQTGDYGYFQIDQNGQPTQPTNSGYYFVRPYILSYTGPSSALQELVRNYGAAHGDALSITLYTTKGEVFRSWVQ